VRICTSTSGEFQYEENHDNGTKISMRMINTYDDAEDDDTHDADEVEKTVTIENLQ